MKNDLTGLIICPVLMVIGGGMLWKASDWQQKSEAAPTWNVVPATITRSQYYTDSNSRADIEYHYEVNGSDFSSEQIFIGMYAGGEVRDHGKRKAASWLLDDFPVGKIVDAYVNPDDPAEAVLLPAAESSAGVLRNFGILFLGSGILFSVVSLAKIFGNRPPSYGNVRTTQRETVASR